MAMMRGGARVRKRSRRGRDGAGAAEAHRARAHGGQRERDAEDRARVAARAQAGLVAEVVAGDARRRRDGVREGGAPSCAQAVSAASSPGRARAADAAERRHGTRPPSTTVLPIIALRVVSSSPNSTIESGHTTSTAPPREIVYTGPSLPRSIARASDTK